MNFKKINTEEEFKKSLLGTPLSVDRLNVKHEDGEDSTYLLKFKRETFTTESITNILLYYDSSKDFFYCNELGFSWFKERNIPFTIVNGKDKRIINMIKISGHLVSWDRYNELYK